MSEGQHLFRVLKAGATIAGHVLARRIAVGGMGDVWVARSESTGQDVAIKVLRATREDRAKARARFKREAAYAQQITHPSVVRVFDLIEEDDGTLVLIMELLHGDSLDRTLARRGPLPQEEAVAILAPILFALDQGHARGIVHRDVKPANIFLAKGPSGLSGVTPKILDFGIAKTAAFAMTTKGRVLGTPSYMSPEQIASPESVDARSDLFSAGVVLYEILTGISPFERRVRADAIDAILRHDVDPDPRIDPRLFLEIRRALRKRPNDRHASAADMARALCAALPEGVGVIAEHALRGESPRGVLKS